ncbi:serine hydrolase [Arthrobacter sp. YD4]|uniref:serine hydrolase n=1 Tax=Arthrobacter sp. YD4 TaxID=3058043 RepID=UPI0025B53BF8|nr:serine hydrolase [Arthrobacter sp. YD4]MDN3935404.1 serine hydrolase [Arthrobacter sp. YD4]
MENSTSRKGRTTTSARRPGTLPSRTFRLRRAVVLAGSTLLLGALLTTGIHALANSGVAPSSPVAAAAPTVNAAAPASPATPAPASPAAAAPTVAPTSAAPAAAASTATPAGTIDAGLDAKINAIIDANPEYQIGVALQDITAGDAMHQYGVEEQFEAASTAKVLAAAAYYHLVETGEATLTGTLGAYSAGFQLQAMIQQSDNDSWSLIMDAIGHSNLSDYASALGIQYTPESNTLAPADTARILTDLYSGKLLDPADTSQLLSTMQDTNDETLIPAAVPAGITVFHKYGLLGGELHDAGILAKDGRAYALVVYTKGDDLDSVPTRTDIIHQITGAVTGALF